MLYRVRFLLIGWTLSQENMCGVSRYETHGTDSSQTGSPGLFEPKLEER